MSVATRVRFTLARRPWIRWIAVLALAATTAQIVRNTDADLVRARRRWEETRTVLVATTDHLPGDPLSVESRELPLVAVPPGAVDTIPRGTHSRWRLTRGQVVVEAHLVADGRPTSLAEPGHVVVAMGLGATSPPAVGTRVQVVGEAIVLASDATIVGVDGDVVWVALPELEAPAVADGVRRNLVSLVLVP